MRKNWDFWTKDSWGMFAGKVRIITGGTELLLNKQQLEHHIERTKENLKRA